MAMLVVVVIVTMTMFHDLVVLYAWAVGQGPGQAGFETDLVT